MDVSSEKTKALRPEVHLDGDGGEMNARRALILLADDDGDLRADVKRLLGERYTVEAVADGQAALVAARARVPDLVLTGMLLPGLDGCDLLRELRSDPRTKTVPVIFLSAGDDEDSRVAGLEAGADDHLVKPFSARELLTRVQKSLELARGRRETEEQLRHAEERYRTLFNSIDEGFCVCEMLFDENGKPIDYRFLEVNAVFEKMTGLVQATGRTARELVPNLEKKWFEIYGRVVLTGEPARFRDGSEPMNRWFDVYAFRIRPSGDRKFAILFNDITERKKFEEERERFLAVGSDLQVITGTNGYFKWVSPAFERTLGWNLEEMISRPWTDFTHPDDVGKSVTETDSLFSGNETFAFENRYRHKDGSYRWFLWNAQPYLKENVIYGAAVDITERKRNEQALRESEERFAKAFNSSPLSVTLTSLKTGKLVEVNDTFLRLTGYSREEAIGRTTAELGLWSQPLDRATELAKVISAGHIRNSEYRFRMKDGTEIVGLLSAELLDIGGESCALTVIQDITERKKAEEKIRESEEKFRDLANSISQFAWMADAEGYIFWYNERWFEYTGTTLEEMRGWGWQSVHHPDEVGHVVDSFKHSIATGEPWEDTFPLRSKTGEYRWFLSRALPIRDEQGRIVRWFGTNTDVEELRRARKTAEEANRLKDEFLATVSHELRTPLTAIIGWTHLLRAERLDAAGAARALETVERNALAQKQLVEDLLDVSRIITGKLRLDLRPCDPASFIEAAIEAVRPTAEAKGVRLQKALDTGVGAVSGDAGRLQQVVWNLLSNAIRYTPRDGGVQVRLERVNSHVEIIVTDTGVGIPAEFLPHVFDRFRQADGSTTRAHGGLGLGLAIVRHLVELHGGTAEADSHGEGQGATFTVK
ncbi:MAG: PAS domain S-box protein, partial [Acidobacteriota bacterium]|nr:PAS domain S-box protein [Acidobacteriota bacterium]